MDVLSAFVRDEDLFRDHAGAAISSAWPPGPVLPRDAAIAPVRLVATSALNVYEIFVVSDIRVTPSARVAN